MKTWKVILASSLFTLIVGGIYLFAVWKHRQDPGVIGQKAPEQPVNEDDLAVVRSIFPMHYEDLQRLEGTSVWMRDGYVMPYYHYAGGSVAFAKQVGVVPADARLDVKKIIKVPVPASLDDTIDHGSRQAFVVFQFPGSKDQYATPVGAMQGNEEKYFTDLLFYYDDPHTIYDHWPKDVWAAIDAHQVRPGMSELETQMAVGSKMHPDGETAGDRTVTYTEDGKVWTVTFQKNRATTISTKDAGAAE
ncbi:MAG: hypothetical protein ABR923_16970 [Terracidiphilus sp.]|jgi:hypothetical protein